MLRPFLFSKLVNSKCVHSIPAVPQICMQSHAVWKCARCGAELIVQSLKIILCEELLVTELSAGQGSRIHSTIIRAMGCACVG